MDNEHDKKVIVNEHADYENNVEQKQDEQVRFTDKKRKEKDAEESTVGGF